MENRVLKMLMMRSAAYSIAQLSAQQNTTIPPAAALVDLADALRSFVGKRSEPFMGRCNQPNVFSGVKKWMRWHNRGSRR